MDAVAEVLAETKRLVGIRLRYVPFVGHGSIKDVLHGSGSSPRISRMIWTPLVCTPWVLRSSFRASSARSWMRRATSGGIGRPFAKDSMAVRLSASDCRASAVVIHSLSQVALTRQSNFSDNQDENRGRQAH